MEHRYLCSPQRKLSSLSLLTLRELFPFLPLLLSPHDSLLPPNLPMITFLTISFKLPMNRKSSSLVTNLLRSTKGHWNLIFGEQIECKPSFVNNIFIKFFFWPPRDMEKKRPLFYGSVKSFFWPPKYIERSSISIQPGKNFLDISGFQNFNRFG